MTTKTIYRASITPATWRPRIEIRAFVEESQPVGGPIVSYIKPGHSLERITAENSMQEIPAFMTMRLEEAQTLMDQMYEAGIRPTAGAGSVGQLSAVQAHLDDMRKLAFQLIGGVKP